MSKRLLAEAHRYLGWGYPIVAVTGKRPVVPWLAYCGRMPGEAELGKQFARPEVTGLALVIGPAVWERHRYLWVLDVEARHRQAAEAWLAERLPHWRQGRVVETGSGGLHLHLVASAPPRTHPCAFGDVKGERSVAVLPPSLHPKGSYRWLHEGEPQALEPEAVPPPARPAVQMVGAPAPAPAYATLAASEPIPEGQRHHVLTSLGGLLRRAGVSEADLDATLQAVNRQRCAPPLPEAEVRQLAHSLARYVPAGAEPAGWLGRRNGMTPHQSGGEGQAGRPLAGDVPAVTPRGDLVAEARLHPPLSFVSPAQLAEQTPAEVPWLWRNYVVRGAVTVLAGREKAGKSTLLWALIAAVLAGREFCGQPVVQTPVVVLSEETDMALVQKFTRFGIGPDSALSVRPRSGLTFRPRWEDAVALTGMETERTGAGLVVVDTLSWWANLPPEAENDAGAMTAALRPLLTLSQRGPAVLVVHHLTKASGELRGSTAIGALADIIVTLSRQPGAPSLRLLQVVGRFSDLSPEPTLLELEADGHYRVLGGAEDLTRAAWQERVHAALAETEHGLTLRELSERLGGSRRHLWRVLRELQAAGAVHRIAPSHQHGPYRFLPGPEPSAQASLPLDGDAAGG